MRSLSTPSRFALAPFVLAFALGAGACKEKQQVSAAPDGAGAARVDGPKTVTFDAKALERLGIKVDVVGKHTTSLDLEVPGSLEYNLDRYAEVGTLVDGRVTAITVKPGDAVKKGKVLAQLVVPSIASAQADYLAAEAAAKGAKENEVREQGLLDKNLTTAREAELAKTEAVKTQAELGAASARLQALGVGRPSSGATISGAGVLTLTSPIDGVVVRRDAVLGRFLQAKETAFVIADPEDLRASLNVYEADLPYFRVGQEAEITIDALPGKVYKGKIVLVEPQIGRASRSARAFIDVPNEGGQLKPGLFVRARIMLPDELVAGRLLVPAPAVQPIGEDDVVFVELQPGQFEVRKVQVVRRTTQVAELKGGVKNGERIAVEGAFVLRGEVTKQ